MRLGSDAGLFGLDTIGKSPLTFLKVASVAYAKIAEEKNSLSKAFLSQYGQQS